MSQDLNDAQRQLLLDIRRATLPSVTELLETRPELQHDLSITLRELEARGLITERQGMFALTHSGDDLLDQGGAW